LQRGDGANEGPPFIARGQRQVMTSRASDQTIYEFGAFRLDPTERLLVGNGQPVPLTPKTFDLLVYLVERRGRLVEKRALLSALWPTTVVEEGNLAYTVSALRKVLDEGANGSSAIETVPTKGYRFVLPVTTTVRPPAAASHSRQSSRRSVWVPAIALLMIVCAGTVWLLRTGWPLLRPTGEYLREPVVRFTALTVGPPDLPIDSAAISPDGKYLAYANPSGIHVKVIDSDETNRISDAPGMRVLGSAADSTRLHVVDVSGTGWDVALVGGGWQRSGLNLPD
jgi:DNA-binding winged helix-turn-helix (wHTH) protein